MAGADKYEESWDRRTSVERILRLFGLLGLLALTIVSWSLLGVRYDRLGDAPANMTDILSRMYPLDVAATGEIIWPLIQTVNIAVLGTLLAIVLALPIAYIGAENTTPNRLTYGLGKFLIVATRSVHVIIWALVFVVIFGTGVLAGILAVGFRSIGFIAKLLAEEIEEIDLTSVEAVQATGANGVDVLVYGIVPQIKPAFVGITTYRWDINVSEATIIGFVGAGGIGVELATRVDFFDWNGVLTILIAILLVVVASEGLSAYLRRLVR
jgi:phosphonate transport system permease protein